MPDLASFNARPGSAKPGDASVQPADRARRGRQAGPPPRTLRGRRRSDASMSAAAIALTRNLNVTAGVRYSQERDRLAPLTDGKQDSQAVYVGTQFRF